MLRSRIQTCRTSSGLFGLATRSVLHRLYRSPGHQVDGGFMTEIFVVRIATSRTSDMSKLRGSIEYRGNHPLARRDGTS